jgi:hypothetical protein
MFQPSRDWMRFLFHSCNRHLSLSEIFKISQLTLPQRRSWPLVRLKCLAMNTWRSYFDKFGFITVTDTQVVGVQYILNGQSSLISVKERQFAITFCIYLLFTYIYSFSAFLMCRWKNYIIMIIIIITITIIIISFMQGIPETMSLVNTVLQPFCCSYSWCIRR